MILMSPFLYTTHLIQVYGQANKPEGYRFPEYKEISILVAFILLWGVVQKTVLAICNKLYDPIVKSQDNPELKAKYIAKSSESTAKGILYSIHFIWGCTILYKTDWIPWYQLGDGLFANQIKNIPFTEVPYDIHFYCLSFSGYYAFQLVDLVIFGRDRVDFHEMMCHHIAATSLVFCMIAANTEPAGIVMAW